MKPALHRTIPTMWAAPCIEYSTPYPSTDVRWFNVTATLSGAHHKLLGIHREWLGYYNINGPFEFAAHNQPTRKYYIS